LFSVDNPTLNRFYSAHYLLPFILAGLSILHLAALHQYGSTNPIGVNAQTDLIPFYPYYALKDLVGFFVLAVFAGFLVFFYPDILGHPDNNIPANPYQTPPHIVPEYENCSLISSLIMKNPTACGKTLITTEIWGKKIVNLFKVG
jgi:ubiquinol-cytochrome c reductase cytochrome b subunit